MKAAAPPAARVYLLYGPDDLGRRRRQNQLLAELLDGEDPAYCVQEFDAGESPKPEEVLNAARDVGMFATRRVVLLRQAELLRQPKHARLAKGLTAGMKTIPAGSALLLNAAGDEGGRRGGLPAELMAGIRKHGQIDYFGLPKPEDLARMIREEAGRLKKRIAPGTAQDLAMRSPAGPMQAVSYLEQLAAFSGDSPEITQAHLDALTPRPLDDNIFHMLDAVLNGDGGSALAIAREMLRGGEAPLRLISMLARSVRQLAQVRLLIDNGVSQSTAAASLSPELRELLPESGMVLEAAPADWQRRRLWRQAAGFDWDRLRLAMTNLTATEAGMKGWDGGIAEPELALECLIATLARR